MSRANEHDMNRCSTDSSRWQKTHFLYPVHLCFAKLPLIKNYFQRRNHKKCWFFYKIFNFHKYFCKYLVCRCMKSAYTDLTEDTPFVVNLHLKKSGSSLHDTCMGFSTKCNQDALLFPNTEHRNIRLIGATTSTSWSEIFWCAEILYKDGYCVENVELLSHTSFQKLVWRPFARTNDPREKKSSLTLINPLQKGECVGFPLTWDNVLSPKYLFVKGYCHIPFLFISLNNHLLKTHLFLISRTSIPSPPWSFGGVQYST